MDVTFRIRYRAWRADSGTPTLFVEDGEGRLYLYSGGKLQLSLDPQLWWPRLCAFLEHAHYCWQTVEGDVGHPLDALAALAAPRLSPG